MVALLNLVFHVYHRTAILNIAKYMCICSIVSITWHRHTHYTHTFTYINSSSDEHMRSIFSSNTVWNRNSLHHRMGGGRGGSTGTGGGARRNCTHRTLHRVVVVVVASMKIFRHPLCWASSQSNDLWYVCLLLLLFLFDSLLVAPPNHPLHPRVDRFQRLPLPCHTALSSCPYPGFRSKSRGESGVKSAVVVK